MFTIRYIYDDGSIELDDEVFETEEEAEEHGLYMHSCNALGAEILNLSNPGDYPLEEASGFEFEVVDLDEEE